MVEIIEPSFSIESPIDGQQILHDIERYGRTCYKSEERITSDSAAKFVSGIIKSGHESVIEHEKVTVRVRSHSRDCQASPRLLFAGVNAPL